MSPDRDAQCIFCKIAEHEIASEIVHETDTVVAFRDTNPKAPTHILLIPQDHIEDLTAITNDHGPLLADIVRAAAHLARAEGIDDGGWRLVANVGPDAGQSVFHVHFHLMGGRKMGWPPG
jgi:histidine triad (HIT) family protein